MVYDSSLSGTSGFVQTVSPSNPTHEVMKDSTQLGRSFYQGIAGQLRLTRADIHVSASARSSTNVYAHELGHIVGLNEHYADVTSVSCVAYGVATVMDCPDASTGPSSHDSSDAKGRFDAAPWGPGAIWISADSGTSITVSWADINDNESGYRVMRTTAPGISGEVQQTLTAPDVESFTQSVTSSQQYCYHLKVTHYLAGDGYSSQICRQTQPSAPTASTGVTAASGGNNYTASISWNRGNASYTHEWIVVYNADAGYPVISTYYVPYHGTGGYAHSVTLGIYDQLAANYYFEVYTCNSKYNPYNAFGCTYAGSATRSLSG